jgi:hypothetical protein
VDDLMALVDQWKAQLAASRAIAANFLATVVAEITTCAQARGANTNLN